MATAGGGYVVGATTALALPQFEPQLRGWLQLMIMGEMAVIVWFVGFSLRRQSAPLEPLPHPRHRQRVVFPALQAGDDQVPTRPGRAPPAARRRPSAR